MSVVDKAYELFASGQYTEMKKLCLEMMETEENSLEAHLLLTNAYIDCITEQTQRTSEYDAHIDYIASRMPTIEMLCKMQQLLEDAFDARRLSYTKYIVSKYIDDPKDFEVGMHLAGFERQIVSHDMIMDITFNVRRKALAAQENMTEEEAERLCLPRSNKNIKLECAKIKLEGAQKVFAIGKHLLINNDDCCVEAAQEIIPMILKQCILAKLMVPSETEIKKFDAEFRRTCLMTKAEIIDWTLNAIIHVQGKAMSIYMGERKSEIYELMQIYEELRKIDPEFENPPIPSDEPINSSSSSSSSSGGCYVATAVYGSYDCPQVWTLRRYRDNTLAISWYGRAFIRLYYAVSPVLVKWFGNKAWFKGLWRRKLDHMVEKLNSSGVEDTPYMDKKW